MASFNVSETTVRLLKNFSTISSQLMLVEGKTQKTALSTKGVFAVAEFPEAWPMVTPIFELNKLIGTLSIYKNPELAFENNQVVIGQGNSRIKYRYADASIITDVSDKNIPVNDPAVSFKLAADELVRLNKTCALLFGGTGLVTITVKVKDGQKAVVISAADAKNPASDGYEIDVADADIVANVDLFEKTITFKTEHINLLMDGDYVVSLANWKYAHFAHKSMPISYCVVAQSVE